MVAASPYDPSALAPAQTKTPIACCLNNLLGMIRLMGSHTLTHSRHPGGSHRIGRDRLVCPHAIDLILQTARLRPSPKTHLQHPTTLSQHPNTNIKATEHLLRDTHCIPIPPPTPNPT